MNKTILIGVCLILSFPLTACSNPISGTNGPSPLTNSISKSTSSQITSIPSEEFKKKAEEKGLNETMVHSLENLGFTKPEILSLSPEKIAEIFAPGALNDGAPAFMADDEQIEQLKKVGIDVKMSAILGNLGFKYDEMLKLTSEEINFIFPNTELIANLAQKGFSKEKIKGLIDQGKTYKEVIKDALRK